MSINVIKFDGEKQPFSEEKIKKSAARVGVPADLQDKLVTHIRSKVYDNIPTSEIFALIKDFLRKNQHGSHATKFNLKSGLAQLGPSGYPFEKYLSVLLAEEGYSTKTNQILAGKCVRHEIDVMAEKDGVTHLIEAKFHNRQGIKADVKVPLYIEARFEDVKSNWKESSPVKPWIITNTRFTTDAEQYGICSDIQLTSWDYPEKDSLRDKIERSNLHPITILDSLSGKYKKILFDNAIVICRQVISEKNKVRNLLPENVYQELIQEAESVCNTK